MSTRSSRLRSSIASSSPSRARKVASPTRSPARNRKTSTERISNRQSPARKSPSRKTVSKYPARKSPSRTIKEKEDFARKSPAKRPAINTNAEVKLEGFSAKFEIYRSTRSKRIEYSINDIQPKPVPVVDDLNGVDSTDSSEYSLRNRRSVEIPPRRSSRLQDVIESIPDIRRSFSKSLSKSSKSVSKTIDTYSDDEVSEIPIREKSLSVVRKLSTPLPSSQIQKKLEFGGIFSSALLVFAIPLTVISILLTCSKSCSHNGLFELAQYNSITTWFNVSSFVIILCQFILQAIIIILPILRTSQEDNSGKLYYFNTFFSITLTLILLFVLDFHEIFNSHIILDSYLQLACISYFIMVILSILLFVKKQNDLNAYGSTGYILYDFFIGREVHPQIRKFNLKLWTYRTCNISTLVLLILILKHSNLYIKEQDTENLNLNNYIELITKVQWKYTNVVFTMMQIMYILYFIIQEYKVVYTFYWQYEGLGYMQLTASALYPFYFTTISKYVVDSGLSLHLNILIGASIIFTMGLTIMFISNSVKYEFRKNPLQPGIVHLESMPTFHGKKLLVSNLWGVVRHPNYLGDILIHIALALPGMLSSRPLAALPALLSIVMLIHRSWRDHCRCKRRYGAAWQRYCKRVPSVLLPKIL